ncbi:MAG TPA: two-component regulator propeller domain-containing protein [Bacteroidales bacterium]|nr:two-component regulator propeller domain-containing protein [Bacteroidales bacterium]
MNRKLSLLLFLLFLFMAMQPLASQEIKSSVSHPAYLENVNDLCMVGDQLWLATSGGLVKFNTMTGTFACYNKSNAGLPVNQVNLVSPYADGQIAYSTAKGIGILRDTTTVSFLTHAALSESLNSKYRTRMEFIDGKLYIGVLNRILIYDQSNWTTLNVLPPYMSSIDLVNDIEPGPNGRIYVARMRGVSEIVGDTSLNDVVNIRSVKDMAFISDVLWMASPYGLFSFKDTLKQVQSTQNPYMKPGLSDNTVIRMKKSTDGKLWLLTRKGLSLFDPTNGNQVTYRTDTLQLAANPMMAVDTLGHVWLVGQKPGRIWKFDGASWTPFSLHKGLASNYISAFVPNGKHVWIGYKDSTLSNYDGKGSCVYDSAALASLKLKHPIYFNGKRLVYFADSSVVVDQDDSIRALIKSGYVNKMAKAAFDSINNVYWSVAKTGIERIKDSILTTISVKALGAATDRIYGLYLEKNGSLLISTYPDPNVSKGGQLLRYNQGSLEILFTCSNPYQYVSAVVRDSVGALWMGIMDVKLRGKMYGGGVVNMVGKNIKVLTMLNSGLPSNSVSDISIDKNGNLWFACFEGGVARLSKTGGWVKYTAENSALESDSVEKVAVDDSNNVWASTLSGGLTFLAADPTASKVATALMPIATKSESSMEIYPMPCTTEVNLKFKDSVTNARVSVFNISGQKIMDESFTVPLDGVLTMPVNTFSKGMYLLRVSTNETTESKRLIVQ